MSVAISITGLNKSFGGRRALDNVSLEVNEGEFVALIGASGSGKSTLLRHITGFIPGDRHSVSRICVGSKVVQQGGRILRHVRGVRAEVGFIFQQFNLVGRLPLITNVLAGILFRVPLWRSLLRWFKKEEIAEGLAALRQVGMADYAWQRTSTLSGGQQQRAAIARSLVQKAGVILADEPIASLDPESARNVMEILTRINREQGRTIIVSLHQVEMALRYCPRVIALQDGRLVYDGPSAALNREMLCCLYGPAGEELLDGDASPSFSPTMPRLIPKAAEAVG
ncbi:MAG: phosphonate ABC transporter ATP-binding protein [Syntrophobacteraceae bacterium]